jgi:hypothetical protein
MHNNVIMAEILILPQQLHCTVVVVIFSRKTCKQETHAIIGMAIIPYSGLFSRGVYFMDFVERAQFANIETANIN